MALVVLAMEVVGQALLVEVAVVVELLAALREEMAELMEVEVAFKTFQVGMLVVVVNLVQFA
jgi:hypothetical protein